MLPAEDSTFDLLGDLRASATRRAPREACPAAALARRIDAPQRMLANPAPVIRRLIRLLASLPEDSLPEPWLARARSLPWWHVRPEAHNAMNLLVPLIAEVRATHPPRPPAGSRTHAFSPQPARSVPTAKRSESKPSPHPELRLKGESPAPQQIETAPRPRDSLDPVYNPNILIKLLARPPAYCGRSHGGYYS